jgi:hypothetical protein
VDCLNKCLDGRKDDGQNSKKGVMIKIKGKLSGITKVDEINKL